VATRQTFLPWPKISLLIRVRGRSARIRYDVGWHFPFCAPPFFTSSCRSPWRLADLVAGLGRVFLKKRVCPAKWGGCSVGSFGGGGPIKRGGGRTEVGGGDVLKFFQSRVVAQPDLVGIPSLLLLRSPSPRICFPPLPLFRSYLLFLALYKPVECFSRIKLYPFIPPLLSHRPMNVFFPLSI